MSLFVERAGEGRIGVEQDLGAVLQLQALALTDHGQVIGLQAQGQVAEVEQAEQQHGGGGQGFPMGTQARQRGDLGRGFKSAGAFHHLRAVPDRLGPGERLAVAWIGRQPGVELPCLFLARVVQQDQPVQRLLHRMGGFRRRSGLGRAVIVRHSGFPVFSGTGSSYKLYAASGKRVRSFWPEAWASHCSPWLRSATPTQIAMISFSSFCTVLSDTSRRSAICW